MEKLTLTLRKAKETKNKVVYGTEDGSVIQSVYIDKDALGDAPPTRSRSSYPRGNFRRDLLLPRRRARRGPRVLPPWQNS